MGLFGTPAAAAGAVTNGVTSPAGRISGSSNTAAIGGPLDVRDAATVTLLGEVAAALKLLHERCGNDFSVHLCSRSLPESGLTADVQQQLAFHVRDSDVKHLKDFLRELLLSATSSKQ